MRIIFLGVPGAGKGTQAQLVCDLLNYPHLSTGDMLRAAVLSGSEIGLKAKAVMDSGALVSDDIVNEIVRERISAPDCSSGFVLDGYPRTLPQADAVDSMLSSSGGIDHVIKLTVDDSVIIDRISGRFSCSSCGEGYHDVTKRPAKDGVCDVCGSKEFVRRSDDNADSVRSRLETYERESAPLVDYYASQGKLHLVDGMGSIDDVHSSIASILT